MWTKLAAGVGGNEWDIDMAEGVREMVACSLYFQIEQRLRTLMLYFTSKPHNNSPERNLCIHGHRGSGGARVGAQDHLSILGEHPPSYSSSCQSLTKDHSGE